MQAAKVQAFNDEEALKGIMSTSGPVLIKRMKINNFDQKYWHKAAPTIVKAGLSLKFSQNQDLKAYLLRTGNKQLSESSPHDKFWGTGIHMEKTLML